ncbi:DUF6542 domain-containing protein [Blastococcus goldschmidtiae]|uniref:DUF6542 domain-containing protein n=1 Tax=Blastococcus goldschmidtiae TaxID=3075546 RepID=A0ABU2KDX0_9ACTN|nr:DUF6542 domain-containing protein [Blastococcus sp. DSM 46792]MDT0278386.1 hypothetical protein [Blastococcus sp. DSM 46792]
MNPDRSARPGRPPVPPRVRPADRLRSDLDHGRQVPPRRESLRPSRPIDHGAADPRPPVARPAAGRQAEARPSARGRAEARPVTGGGRFRGAVAVLGIFLVTLAGAAIDSFVGIGLGVITLAALLASTAVAVLTVRRRDLFSVVVAPPLVFVAVAAFNIALAPSASFTLPTVATLLIRGFPTMAMATGLAVVLAVGRLIARR